MKRDDLHSRDQAQPAMPDHEIATRYCRYVDEVLNHHRLDAIADYMAADAVSHAHGVTAGPAGPRDLVGSLLGAFPDLHLTIDALAIVEGELLARLTATGTHVGPFLHVPPTGRRVRVCAFEAWQLKDGLCAEQWLQLDLTELFQQLGASLTTVPT